MLRPDRRSGSASLTMSVASAALPLGLLTLGLLAATATPAASQSLLPGSIETQELGQLDAWTVGALSRSQGALDTNLWANTDPDVLAVLLDRLPANYESPAAQNLARRVLLSGGTAPRGDALAASRKRFEALGKMGAADELALLAAGAGASLTDPLIAQYAAQAELARGQRAQACARGRASEAQTPAAFMLRLRAYCAAAGGDRAAADLALELARANGHDDAWYTGATAAAGGAPGARPPAARYDNSLNVALSAAGALRPGPNPINNSSTLALIALARTEAAPQPFRAQAAALAYRRGGLSAADARAILRATPIEVTQGLPTLVTALRAVEAAPGSLEAAAAIAGEIRRAASPGDLAAISRFFHDDIAALTTAPDPASTVLFARAALASGDIPLATRVIEISSTAGLDAATLAPLQAALAASQGPQGANASAVVTRRIDAAGASMARAAARDVTILAALGFPLDGTGQTFLLTNSPQGGNRADAGVMTALAAARDRGAVGDVGILAALAASPGANTLDAGTLAELIRALRGAGFESDARALAVEALLAGAPAS